MALLTATFEDILAGAAGPVEARAAQAWLNRGAVLEPRPAGGLLVDEGGCDMRILEPPKQRPQDGAAPARQQQQQQPQPQAAGAGAMAASLAV